MATGAPLCPSKGNLPQQERFQCSSPVSKASYASSAGEVHLWGRLSAGTADLDVEDSQFFCDENVQEQRGRRPQSDPQPIEDPPSSSSHYEPLSTYGGRCSAALELLDMILTEMQREREVVPPAGYLSRPDMRQGDDFVTPQMRSIVTSWLSEVASEFGMQQETLFLAVALLDRFQATSPAGVPRTVLQLVAVACMMVASKQDEVSHPTVDEFTEIAADAFKREDLLRMERLLLDQIDWRVQLPTAYAFLHLLTQALAGRLSPRAIALSAYLSELSLVDYAMLQHPPSLVAAAALSVGAAWHGGAAEALEDITGYTAGDLGPCAAQLLHLHRCASAAEAAPAYQPLGFVRDKYAQEHWLSISRQEPPGGLLCAAGDLGLPFAHQPLQPLALLQQHP